MYSFRFQKPDRKTMRELQTGNYLDFKDFERALSSVSTDKRRDLRLNVDIATPDNSRSTGNMDLKSKKRAVYTVI